MFYYLLDLLKLFFAFIGSCCRSLLKGFLRRTTRLSELQRICYGSLRGGARTYGMEEALVRSRNETIRKQMSFLGEAVKASKLEVRDERKSFFWRMAVQISESKGIKMNLHESFVLGLAESLEIIWSYKYMSQLIEGRMNTPYDRENPSHEKKLIQIWNNLRDDELSGRTSKQWQELGFQGTDPMTDFRSAGLLALEALLYLSSVHASLAGKLLKSSQGSHRVSDYPFALVAIHVSVLGQKLWREGGVKRVFYGQTGTILTLGGTGDGSNWDDELLSIFFDFFSSLFVEFNEFWMVSRPVNVMKFREVWTDFEKMIRLKLDRNIPLQMEFRTV